MVGRGSWYLIIPQPRRAASRNVEGHRFLTRAQAGEGTYIVGRLSLGDMTRVSMAEARPRISKQPSAIFERCWAWTKRVISDQAVLGPISSRWRLGTGGLLCPKKQSACRRLPVRFSKALAGCMSSTNPVHTPRRGNIVIVAKSQPHAVEERRGGALNAGGPNSTDATHACLPMP